MKSYSFFCDDAEGFPQYSEVRAFRSVAAALGYAQHMLPEVGRIELWWEGVLVHSLHNTQRPRLAEKAEAAASARLAFLRADRERTAAHFDFLKSATSDLVGVPEIPGSLRSEASAFSFPSYVPSVWLPLGPTPLNNDLLRRALNSRP